MEGETRLFFHHLQPGFGCSEKSSSSVRSLLLQTPTDDVLDGDFENVFEIQSSCHGCFESKAKRLVPFGMVFGLGTDSFAPKAYHMTLKNLASSKLIVSQMLAFPLLV
jgi:hypothetical protein